MRRLLAPLLPSALLAVVALLALACGGSSSETSGPTDAAGKVSGKITVFAASSLTKAFNEEKRAFEAAHPGITVEFNFAGSPTLRTQLEQGADADVLAIADQTNMDAAQQSHLILAGGTTFARNKLVVIVPKSNPANITTPYELGKSGLKLVIAQQGVPAGDYARQVFANMEADAQGGPGIAAAVLSNVVSEEANVKAVVSKVQLGEADAGIVYATDVTPDLAADITLIAIPDNVNIIATYPIAVTANVAKPVIAQGFIEFVLSPAGQQILAANGFLPAQ